MDTTLEGHEPKGFGPVLGDEIDKSDLAGLLYEEAAKEVSATSVSLGLTGTPHLDAVENQVINTLVKSSLIEFEDEDGGRTEVFFYEDVTRLLLDGVLRQTRNRARMRRLPPRPACRFHTMRSRTPRRSAGRRRPSSRSRSPGHLAGGDEPPPPEHLAPSALSVVAGGCGR